MERFLHGGIIKEITIYYKSSFSKLDVLSDLGDKIDLNLFDITEYPNCLMLDIKKSVLRNNICDLLDAIEMNFDLGSRSIASVKYIKENSNIDILKVLDYCDDMFMDRYRVDDTFSINSDKYMVDIVYYAFYFDGPYGNGNFSNLVNYIHSIHRKALNDNPLNGALCFGVN